MRSKTEKAQAYFLRLFAMIVAATLASPLAAAPAAASAQEATGRGDKPQQPVIEPVRKAPDVLVSPEEDYKIGPRDVLEITVEKAPELSRTWSVTAKGYFHMDEVGRVVAVGKTPEEVAAFIADRLRGGYLKDPRVRVVVKQYNSRSFFIQGAVRSPGVYQIEGRASLLTLVILAGGLSETHGSTAFIIRKLKPGTEAIEQTPRSDADAVEVRQDARAAEEQNGTDGEKYELIKANISWLLKGNFDQNIIIEPGDFVNVPQADVFFVAGEVRSPGSYTLKEGTTLRQAISLAQGTTFKAAAGRGIIFREEPGTGKRTDIKVDIDAVMSGKKADVPIMANDIVIVPNSRMKSVGGALLSAFGMHAVIRGLPPY
jgi:polysaccharide export outer membrane protein